MEQGFSIYPIPDKLPRLSFFSPHDRLVTMKKTVLIFGVSSFVGSNLAQCLKDDFRVVGTYFETPVHVPGITCYPCDVLKKDYVNNLVSRIKPDFTVYAIGLSSLTLSRDKPKLADALNSVGAANACRSAERYGSKFVYISSAFVLGGEGMNYKEGDIPMPTTSYGNSVSASEFYVQRSCINYLILRCCALYGRSYNPAHPNWFECMQAGLAKHENVPADESIAIGFLDVTIFAKVLKTCLDMNVTNRLLQVSTPNIMSRFEFAKTYARLAHKEENLIVPFTGGLPLDNAQKTKVSGNKFFYQMDITNIEEVLGSKLPKIEESLQFTIKRLNQKISAKSS
jgi:dTDP-4-dehydrorhamnose reductase